MTRYDFVSVDGDKDGVIAEGVTYVTYTYKLIPEEEPEVIATGKVIVRYLDEEGYSLAASVTIPGNVGDDYQSEQLKFNGYDFVSIDGDKDGVIAEGVTYVTYTYKLIPEEEPEIIKTGKVIVRYLDQDGYAILPMITIAGNVGDDYLTEQLKIDGYTFKEVSGDTTGQITEGTSYVVYTYELVPEEEIPEVKEGIVIVHYEDEHGNVLANDEIITGIVGSDYYTVKKAIDGYVFVSVNNKNGVISEELIEVTYKYQKVVEPEPEEIKTGKVIVRYLDEEGYTLSPMITINGNVGDDYQTEQLKINGYEISTVSGEVTGTIDEETQYVIYTYKLIVDEPVEEPTTGYVIVKYVDQDGNLLTGKKVLDGLVGSKYFTSQEVFTGYNFVSVDRDEDGVFTEEIITITYKYEKIVEPEPEEIKTGKVIVRYYDENGYSLVSSVTISGNVGDDYQTEQLKIDGYDLSSIEGDRDGVIAEGVTYVTYTYKLIPEEEPEVIMTGKVIVRYLDEEGYTLSPMVTINGNVGDDYQSEQLRINGYEISSVDGDVVGTINEETQYVTYTYKLIVDELIEEPITGKVIVRYLDNDGYSLTTSVTISGIVGTDYQTEQFKFDGYRINNIDGDITGSIKEEVTYVTYYYNKIAIGTVIAHYYDQDGNAIADDIVLTGEEGTSYVAPIINVEGYTLDKVEKVNTKRLLLRKAPEVNGNNIGLFTDDTIEIVFTYIKDEVPVVEPTKYGTVIVSYEDVNGNVLASEEVLTGEVNTSYYTIKKPVTGYTFKEIVGNKNGIFTEELIEVIYVYELIPEDIPEEVKTGKVVVRYLDDKGYALTGSITIPGNVGDDYQTEQLKFNGYEISSVEGDVIGTISEGVTYVTYVYQLIPEEQPEIIKTGKVIVRYLDENGYTLSPMVTIIGNVGDDYQSEQLKINGYEISSVSGDVTGTIGEETAYVIYTYKLIVDEPVEEPKTGYVIVKYVDQDGNLLIGKRVLDGLVGSKFFTSQEIFTGYNFVSVDRDEDGVFTEEIITITYKYEKIVEPTPEEVKTGKVIVRYLNDKGYTLSPMVTIERNVGDDYITEQLEFNGYEIYSVNGVVIGTISEETQYVTYTYKLIEEEPVVEPQVSYVIVKYVDENGNLLAEKEVKKGYVGEQYFTSQKVFNGYNFVSVDNDEDGIFGEQTITITYKYEKIADPEPEPEPTYGRIIVHYEDEHGNPVADDSISRGIVNSEYVISKKAIQDYEFLYSNPRDIEYIGQYSEGNTEITFVYRKVETEDTCSGNNCCNNCGSTTTVVIPSGQCNNCNPCNSCDQHDEDKYSMVVAHYQDESGKTISNDQNQTGKVDTPYVTNDKVIEGYELIRVEGSKVGFYKETVIEVTYVYRKVTEEEPTPEPEPTVTNGVVIAHYLDEYGLKIDTDEAYMGPIGTIYNTIKKTIADYIYKNAIGNTSGVYTTTPIEVTYLYNRVIPEEEPEVPEEPKTGKVIVRYLDEDENSLTSTITIPGNVDDEYYTDQLVFKGYTLKRIEGNKNGLISEGTTYVTYIYEVVPEEEPEIPEDPKTGKVIVKYLNEEGYSLTSTITISGNVNDDYFTDQLVFDGYELSSIQGERNGFITEGVTYVTYIYKLIPEEVPEEPKTGKVVVRYLDEDGYALTGNITIPGNVGDDYQTEQLKFNGYEIATVEGDKDGIINEGVTYVTYTYRLIPEEIPEEPKTGKVIVRYLDQNENALRSTITISGNVDDEYFTDQLVFSGYTFNRVEGSKNGLIVEGITYVTYIYDVVPEEEPEVPEEPKKGIVIAHYVDKDGNPIADDEVYNGFVGDPYAVPEKSVEGYILVNIDKKKTEPTRKLMMKSLRLAPVDDKTGNFEEGIIEITFVYDKDEETASLPEQGTLIVRYLDNKMVPLTTDEVATMDVGTLYNTVVKSFEGYKLISTDGVTSGLLPAGITRVLYIYELEEEEEECVNKCCNNTCCNNNCCEDTCCDSCEEKKGVVIAHYQDKNGVKLATDEASTDTVGELYNTNEKNIENYKLVNILGDSSGVYVDGTIHVYYIYDKEEEITPPTPQKEMGRVIVEYITSLGSKLRDDIILEDEVGKAYQTYELGFDNYYFIQLLGNSEGNFTKEDITVTYVYDNTSLIKIRHIDTEGNDLDKTSYKVGRIGEEYTTNEKEFEGYYLLVTPYNQNGKYIKETQTITYVYAKYGTGNTEPDEPVTPTPTNTVVINVDDKTSNPRTADSIVSYIVMLGLSLIGLCGVGIYSKKYILS